jgi:hypothetical protein
LPCPECGSEARDVKVRLVASVGFGTNMETAARSANDVDSRARQLDSAIADIGAAVADGRPSAAQDATKRALEAIHELADCLKRGEWVQTGWSADDVGLWHGLIGARNASHHTSSEIVVLRSGEQPDERLRWDLDAAAIAELDSKRQRAESSARAAGEPVVLTLRTIATLIATATS